MPYGLNDEQYDAVVNCGSPAYVNASAGSGKTRCLITKVQYLITEQKIPPENILAVTFTNKAANEMKERLKKHSDISKMQISTIHSLCVRIIRAFHRFTYLKMPFTIFDDSDQQSIIKTIIKSWELPGDPYEYLGQISKCKGEDKLPEDPVLLKVYNQYQEILKKNNGSDFDDLLLIARDLLKDHQVCKDYFISKWQHILVDEFQDTSLVQFQIITLLYDPKKTKTMFCVGDLSQAIYGWRSARPENVNDFIKDYKANVRYLTYNYRSCNDVIQLANKFQQFGKPMVAKTSTTGTVSLSAFESQEDEAEKIAMALKQMNGHDKTAIIYRANARSLHFEQTFARYHIPYKVVNELPFFQRRVCKDLLSALKAANNLADVESLSRIINTPRRGFGDAKKEQLLIHGRQYAVDMGQEMPQVKGFLELLEGLQGQPPAYALTEYLNQSGYRETLEKESDIFMVGALQDAVVSYESVEELILASSFLERDAGEGVNLITAHASKGLEFDRVFVVGVEDGLWPHKNSEDILEEERLFYVAVTRSRSYLNISYSKSKAYRGNRIETTPSQFFEKVQASLR